MEIAAEKGLIDYVPEVSSDDAPTNTMALLTKYRPGVTFHDPSKRQDADSYKFKHKDPTTDTDENRNAKVRTYTVLLFLAIPYYDVPLLIPFS